MSDIREVAEELLNLSDEEVIRLKRELEDIGEVDYIEPIRYENGVQYLSPKKHREKSYACKKKQVSKRRKKNKIKHK